MPAKKTTRKTAPKEKPKSPAELALPTTEAVEAARAARKARTTTLDMQPGKVLGLPDGWRSALIDPMLEDGEIARIDARWTAKGWIKLDGLHTVTGYPMGAIVYVKSDEDYDQARKERAERIEAARRAGLMH
jgi:hypothetical protein